MKIRIATKEDLQAIAEVESRCFPKAEAATEAQFKARLAVYPNHFWLLEQDNQLISFINGLVCNEPYLRDEMYSNAALHNEKGEWQMIFGVNTIPEYRRRGYAAKLMRQVIAAAKEQGRKGLVLTCKKEMRPYYERFGFKDEGVSESVHGGVVWHNMRLVF